MSGNRHIVSPAIGMIAATEKGESDAGESEGEDEQMESVEDREEKTVKGEVGQESIGICEACRSSISQVEMHSRTHTPSRNWFEIYIKARALDMPHKLREKKDIGVPIVG